MSKVTDYYKSLSESFIQNLYDETTPWQKPWETSFDDLRPINGLNHKPYRGANSFSLINAASGKYTDNRWVTFNQSKDLGISVKGATAIPIFYYSRSQLKAERDENNNVIKNDLGKIQYGEVSLDKPVFRYTNVFNFDQTDHAIDHPNPDFNKKGLIDDGHISEAGKKIINFVERLELTIKEGVGARGSAFYDRSSGEIWLPHISTFDHPGKYYSTLLHESCHAFYDKAGLGSASPFGSPDYAKEEMRVEMSSYLLGVELGVGHDPTQHRAYVRSWAQAIENNPFMINMAGKDAYNLAETMSEIYNAYDNNLTPDIDSMIDRLRNSASSDLRQYSEYYNPAQAITISETTMNTASPPDLTIKALREDLENFRASLTDSIVLKKPEYTFLAVPYEQRKTFVAALNKDGMSYKDYTFNRELKLWAVKTTALDRHAEVLNPYIATASDLPASPVGQETKESFFARKIEEAGILVSDLSTHDKWVRSGTIDAPESRNGSYQIRTPRRDNEAWVVTVNNYADGGEPSSFAYSDKSYSLDPRHKLVSDAINANAISLSQAKKVYESDIQTALKARVQIKINEYLSVIPSAVPVSTHDYLKGKGFENNGNDDRIKIDADGLLVVPVNDASGQLLSLQTINANGDKFFLPNTEVKGGFYDFGLTDAAHSPTEIIVCEGYATGRSLYEATHTPVIVAFNSNNIAPVLEEFRQLHPETHLILAGDNDFDYAEAMGDNRKMENAINIIGGYHQTAADVGATTLLPSFEEDNFKHDNHGNNKKLTDWNDLMAAEGIGAVTQQINHGKQGISVKENKRIAYVKTPSHAPHTQVTKNPTLAVAPKVDHKNTVREDIGY